VLLFSLLLLMMLLAVLPCPFYFSCFSLFTLCFTFTSLARVKAAFGRKRRPL
jgi:hypothetical protein